MSGPGRAPAGKGAAMVGETRWVSYDEAADLLGLSPEATMRLALRRGWPRRAAPMNGTQIAVSGEASGSEDPDVVEACGGRTLLGYLELRVEQLSEELAEARTEMRGIRYEAESLRVDAGRAQVLAALIEAERARYAEVRAERDRLAGELARRDRPWMTRVIDALTVRPPADRRAS